MGAREKGRGRSAQQSEENEDVSHCGSTFLLLYFGSMVLCENKVGGLLGVVVLALVL